MQKSGMNRLWKYSTTTGINEHKFIAKLVSMSRFLKLVEEKRRREGGLSICLVLNLSRIKREVKLRGECRTVKSTLPISFFRLLFSSGFMKFSLLIHKVMAYLTPPAKCS